MTNSMQKKSIPDRPERVISHALVEIRRHLWWPFGVRSAVLLDLSPQGFKVEFTGSVACKNGDTMWMQIPLSPFGVPSPPSFSVRIMVKWFDGSKMRIGGIFVEPDDAAKIYLEKIIEKVKDQAS